MDNKQNLPEKKAFLVVNRNKFAENAKAANITLPGKKEHKDFGHKFDKISFGGNPNKKRKNFDKKKDDKKGNLPVKNMAETKPVDEKARKEENDSRRTYYYRPFADYFREHPIVTKN